MNQQERIVISFVLACIACLVVLDIVTDFKEGVVMGHVLLEAIVGVIATSGIFYIYSNSSQLRKKLLGEQKKFREFKQEAETWRNNSRKVIQGLASAIDQQLNSWHLSKAERDVAFLLLKGLSLKDIAQIRSTSEKTIRTQTQSIYSKSGLAGRAELSAYFLEDLLVPSTKLETP